MTATRDAELQAAYEAGFHQEYDHDSFALLDRIETAVDGEPDDACRCELRAAWLEGAAEALLELADRQRDNAALWRADGEDDAA
jgi:hypothetical protein